MIDGVQSIEYTIFYQINIKSIRFLKGHKSFDLDLVYNSIYQYALNIFQDPDVIKNDKKLYEKMNRGD